MSKAPEPVSFAMVKATNDFEPGSYGFVTREPRELAGLHLARIRSGRAQRTLCGKTVIRTLPGGLFNISEATCIECRRRAAVQQANPGRKDTSVDAVAKVIGLIIVVVTVIIFLKATSHDHHASLAALDRARRADEVIAMPAVRRARSFR